MKKTLSINMSLVKRLEEVVGLEVIAMPHALKGLEFVENNPELRVKVLMGAFKDRTIIFVEKATEQF